MRLRSLIVLFVLSIAGVIAFGGTRESAPEPSVQTTGQSTKTTVRTENYPRPPYSGATYYIYERDGEVICTKLEVCNKFDDCNRQYKKGVFKEEEDVETGEPYGKTSPVVISTAKQRKHLCLTKFKLLK